MISITNVEDASRSTRLLAQTTLRNILGTKTLAEVLSDRETISGMMQVNEHRYQSKQISLHAYVENGEESGEIGLSYESLKVTLRRSFHTKLRMKFHTKFHTK